MRRSLPRRYKETNQVEGMEPPSLKDLGGYASRGEKCADHDVGVNDNPHWVSGRRERLSRRHRLAYQPLGASN